MELHQLAYFVCAAKYESASKAAKELHISQPALSKSIARLEAELDTKLFNRANARWTLTDEGRFFQYSADRVLRSLDDGVCAMKHMSDGMEESLRLGVFGSQRPALACIDAFMTENPHVRVTVESKQAFKGQPLLHEYDAVFYPEGSSFDSLQGLAYAQCRLSVVVPVEHRLARLSSVAVGDLKNEELILLDSTSNLLELSYRLCERAGFYPRVRAVVTNRVAQKKFVRSGHGIGITDGVVSSEPSEGTLAVPLDIDEPGRSLRVAFRSPDSLSAVAQRFRKFAISFFELEGA